MVTDERPAPSVGTPGRLPRRTHLGLLVSGLPLAQAKPGGNGWAWQSAPHVHYQTLWSPMNLLFAALIVAVPYAVLHSRRARRSGNTAQ
jgi:hypothetical protein